VDIFLCWLLCPALIVLVALGCGLLAETLSGLRLNGPLVPGLGLAMVIVVGDFATMSSTMARLAVPLVAGLAICGYGLSRRWRDWRFDRWALVTALAVFAVFAAPIVLSGSATFAGYISLDDTATWLALTDHVMEHGRSLAGLAPSTYQQVLTDYLSSGYPLGSFIPLGLGRALTGQDVAWLFQPTIATYAAMLALSIYTMCTGLITSARLRAGVAFLGAQPALTFQYAFWSGIKELAAATLLSLIAALVGTTVARWSGLRSVLPVAVAVAALLAVLSLAGAVWLLIPGVIVAGILLRRPRALLARTVVRLGGLVALLSIPSLALASTFAQSVNGAGNRLNQTGGLLGDTHLGNLGHALNNLQVLGVWPATDFRSSVHNPALTHILFVVVGLGLVSGLTIAWRRRVGTMPLYLAIGLGGFLLLLVLDRFGLSSPWLDAKAMAEGSPAVLSFAVAGVAAVFETGRRTEAVLACAAIAVGVLWSNGLSYRNVWLAPRAQLAELETIGKRFAGDGPALMTEFQPYGVRHFLRSLDPEGASERRHRVIPLRTGGVLTAGESADLDQFQLGAVLAYRTLVLRTSPVESRPPSVYHLVWRGHWYEVWQRPQAPRRTIEHLSLGTTLDPAAAPSCRDVLSLAREAVAHRAMLATVAGQQPPTVADVTQSTHPAAWSVDNDLLAPSGAGTISLDVNVPSPGRYGIWIGGSFRRSLTASIDGRQIGTVTRQLNNSGQWTRLGVGALSGGGDRVTLRYGGSPLAPGSGGYPMEMGPLVLSKTTDDPAVTYLRPSDARRLCGQRLDWIEVVGS
jgi:hypothetical protein